MAARRLLVVMLLLLAVSTLAAALVPPPEDADETADEPPPSAPAPARGTTGGELVRAEVIAFPRRRAERIGVAPGDQLALTVTSGRPGPVTIPELGLLRYVSPGSPARFDVFLDREGRFEVRFQRQLEVATIVSSRDD